MASGSEPTQPGHFLAVGLREAFAGTIISMLSIAYGLSYAALIFSGPLTPALGYGIAATFITGAISAAVVALRSSLPFAIAGPDSSVSAVNATLVAALIEQLATRGRPEQLVMPALIIMALAAALTGLLLCGLGITRAGRAIRFVPYPVIGGFLGATGWVMVTGAVRVITDNAATFENLPILLTPLHLSQLAAGLAVALRISSWPETSGQQPDPARHPARLRRGCAYRLSADRNDDRASGNRRLGVPHTERGRVDVAMAYRGAA